MRLVVAKSTDSDEAKAKRHEVMQLARIFSENSIEHRAALSSHALKLFEFRRTESASAIRLFVAQVGFTRFEAAAPDTEGELEMGVRRAPLAREISWLPAIENKGEGIFLQFNQEAIESWLARPDVQDRGRKLDAGFQCWLRDP